MKVMLLQKEDGNPMTPQEVINLTQESITLCRLEHPNIIKYYDSFAHDDFYCLVTEFCEGGDLLKRLESYKSDNKKLTKGQLVDWIIQ